jgi:hypothetical protein
MDVPEVVVDRDVFRTMGVPVVGRLVASTTTTASRLLWHLGTLLRIQPHLGLKGLDLDLATLAFGAWGFLTLLPLVRACGHWLRVSCSGGTS